ncbi:MAG: DNA polymerase III subunit beta [Porticoccaceae bacterium]|nr:DNA polymerase III subunit beta [Pseudomonadales bacterium]MCP5172915.1 DNA polymerase III subunit beta [Pseudomonadales bacterium]MCP5302389.1 DNA polymerase III subunit beta [Pseudomonadales bacterium]
MKFSVSREALLKPLQLVVGVVERRQTLPILSNVLISLQGNRLELTGTDLEVEIVGQVALEQEGENGEVTVPARKLVDICRSLPEGAVISISEQDGRAQISSGRSRFTLATLPANEFPSVDEGSSKLDFEIPQQDLKYLIDSTAFAMAQQDVRYYLNGMLWEVEGDTLRAVATDGHRLAMAECSVSTSAAEKTQAILPRKGVIELSRMLDGDQNISIMLGNNHLRIVTPEYRFTSKLVDGAYPDYRRVLPQGGSKLMEGGKDELRHAFSRTAILSNEKYRGVRLMLSDGLLKLVANNPEQEEAQEEVTVNYSGDELEIGFNVSYVLDVLGVLKGESVRFTLSDSNSSALVEDPADNGATYVVMPMRL